ncbi:MAG: type II toxin-antitoxin system HicB family antitoxin [Nitrospirae bacterium]|nr:type II toxin-antitoxin system HicB family antitoxin [Nitrospirota bacterium]
MMEKFTAVFEKEGDWWIGYVEELPGANTQGRTLDETRENLKEAVRMIIEANCEITRQEHEGENVLREELTVVDSSKARYKDIMLNK